MEDDTQNNLSRSETDLDQDFSFTSTTTDRTFTSSTSSISSARTSLARTSLNLSFNDSRLSETSNTVNHPILHHRPHRQSDPNWSAIKAAINLSDDGTLHLRHLKLIRHLGTGNLGRVFLCRLRDYDGASFALKVVDKDVLTSKKLSHVQMEAEILSGLDHPFLPTLYAHLEVSHYTCLLIDYCPGGDLHQLLRKQPGNRFPIDAVRFFAAEILVALEYLHAKGVIYRDLKPENVLLREDGHIMLSDFDLCFRSDLIPKLEHRRIVNQSRSEHESTRFTCYGSGKKRSGSEEMASEFTAEPTSAFSKSCVGTHEYLSPELVTGAGHGAGVDWWAFGIFIYELIYGNTPFKGVNKETTLRNIASTRDVLFPLKEKEEKGVDLAKDLIGKLLVKDPRGRLGCARGATDIKRHPFFDGIKWPLIRTYRPPDVRGLMRKTTKGHKHVTSHVSHVPGGSPRRKMRWVWRGIDYFVKSKGSKRNLKSNNYNNNNYYCHVDKKC